MPATPSVSAVASVASRPSYQTAPSPTLGSFVRGPDLEQDEPNVVMADRISLEEAPVDSQYMGLNYAQAEPPAAKETTPRGPMATALIISAKPVLTPTLVFPTLGNQETKGSGYSKPESKPETKAVKIADNKQPRTNILSEARGAIAVTTSSKPKPKPDPKPTQVGQLYGELTWDDWVDQWLARRRGHVELYLYPKGSQNPSDVKFIGYQFPGLHFDYDLEGVAGEFQLVAGIYTSDRVIPIAQVIYPTVIHGNNYKQNIKFHLRRWDMLEAIRNSNSPKGILLTITVFEVGIEPSLEKPVNKATVSIVGHPNFKPRTTDKDGNVRFENVPNGSELLIKIESPSHFTNYRVAPIFQEDSYFSYHLVPKKPKSRFRKLLSHLKIPNSIKKNMGMLFGRVFDSKTRKPTKDMELGLTYRKKPKKGSKFGLFGFVNLSPSVRFLTRSSNNNEDFPHVFLTSIRENSALYIEFGRSGKRNLSGTIADPFNGTLEGSVIRVVGDEKYQELSDESGRFIIPGVDLEDGVITLEASTPGYPLSWHTLPWRVLRKGIGTKLFVMDQGLVDESLKSIKQIKWDRSLGAIIGGAESKMFSKKKQCVFVDLLDVNGTKIPKSRGPYPILDNSPTGAGKLCLTKEMPGFTFLNLKSGEYLLRWKDSSAKVYRSHVIRVGSGRISYAVN